MTKKRTLKQYIELYRRPSLLSRGGPADQGAEITLFPNGEREIWIRSKDGLGFRLSISDGPCGLGVQISRFVGTADLTTHGLTKDGGTPSFDVRDLEICQYRQDARSQAYKRWYSREETEDDIRLLGDTYRRTSETGGLYRRTVDPKPTV